MQTNFDVVLRSINDTSVFLPKLGDTVLPAGEEIQLLNASVNIINTLRNMFSTSGVTVSIGKKAERPFATYDLGEEKKDIKEKAVEAAPPKYETPLEKVSNFEMPSGKYKGQKIKDIDDESLKIIARTTKTQMVKSAIEAYFNLR